MKKVLCACLTALTMFVFYSVPLVASAQTDAGTDIPYDSIAASQTNENTAHGLYDFDNSEISTRATNIINSVTLTLVKDGHTLKLYAQTESVGVALKVGFTEVVVQRLVNGEWTTYTQWTDYYFENTGVCSLGKAITNVPSGTYRAYCYHYAEKDGFLFWNDKQEYYNETSTVVIS